MREIRDKVSSETQTMTLQNILKKALGKQIKTCGAINALLLLNRFCTYVAQLLKISMGCKFQFFKPTPAQSSHPLLL